MDGRNLSSKEEDVDNHDSVVTFDRNMDYKLARNQYPDFMLENNSYMRQVLTPELFQKLKDHKTATGSWTLAQTINTGIMNQDSLHGCHAGDYESYYDFKEFFDPLIEMCHGGYGPDRKHTTDMDPSKLKWDISDKSMIKSTRIRVARNLAGFPLNPRSTREQRLEIESLMRKVFDTLEGDLSGTYYSLATLSEEEKQQLVDDHFLFKPGDRFQVASGYHTYWPAGRGIFHNRNKTFLLWLNEGDHLRIISMEQGGHVKSVFSRLARGVAAIETGINKITCRDEAFLHDDHLGMITCCPSNLGTGLRASVHIALPTLFRNNALKKLNAKVREIGCIVRGTYGEHTEIVDATCDVSNLHRIGRAEYKLVQNMNDCVNTLIIDEKEQQTA